MNFPFLHKLGEVLKMPSKLIINGTPIVVNPGSNDMIVLPSKTNKDTIEKYGFFYNA